MTTDNKNDKQTIISWFETQGYMQKKFAKNGTTAKGIDWVSFSISQSYKKGGEKKYVNIKCIAYDETARLILNLEDGAYISVVARLEGQPYYKDYIYEEATETQGVPKVKKDKDGNLMHYNNFKHLGLQVYKAKELPKKDDNNASTDYASKEDDKLDKIDDDIPF